ncbi:MFS transporter [Nocardioides korecus]
MRTSRGLAGVLSVLMATGWAANHFAAVIPVLAGREGLSAVLLDGVFGVYALGLLPGLFGGGTLSDRVGRPLVVLPGAAVAALGTVVLLASHEPTALLVGRLVVGLGAGLTFGAGTAWCADLGGAAGTVLAGVFLTSGFAVGPLVSGLLAQLGPAPLRLPFVASLVLSLVTVLLAARLSVPETRARLAEARGRPAPAVDPVHSARAALAWSLPVGLVVFASPTITIVTLPPRLPTAYDGPLLVGVAAILALGTGIVIQTVARQRAWGPRSGVAGAACSAAGFTLMAATGPHLGLVAFAVICVLMGLAYGLCLREGLLDVETLSPPARRGTLTGLYYVVTYLGFGVPLLLVAVRPAAGVVLPALALALVALLVAVGRALQLRHGHPARST